MKTLNVINVLELFIPYPFGMLMVGRNFESGSGYRYGFNGKENDDEVNGNNNAIDFGERIYDSRLGRWLSLDPLMSIYPNFSPYGYTLDNPIMNVDFGGRDVAVAIERNPNGGGKITLTSTIYVVGENATNLADQFNEAFITWSGNGSIIGKNKGTYIDENDQVWEIEINMEFKISDDAEIEEKVENQIPGSEPINLIKSGDYERSKANYLDLPEQHLSGLVFRGYREILFNKSDDGFTAIHEVLHLYGLIDRYSDADYEMYRDGKFIGIDKFGTGFLDRASTPHAGYEHNVMGGSANSIEDMNLNDTQFGNLAKAMLRQSANCNCDNFVFSESPNNVEATDSSIPSEYTSGDITFKNPAIKEK